MNQTELGLLIVSTVAAVACVALDYLIYKYVRMEYEESKSGNQLLKRILNSRKKSTAKALIKEVLKQDVAA